MGLLSSKTAYGALLLMSSGLAINAYAGNTDIYEPSLLPSNPQAGQCYARVHIPAKYSSTPETVMVAEGHSTVEVDQARLASRSEKIEVKEASIRYEVRQPTFRTVTEQMMVRPSYDKLSVVAPQFKTVREVISTSGPRRVWKLGNPGALAAQGYRVIGTADAGTNGQGYRSTVGYGASRSKSTHCGAGCEIWCLVEEPGQSVSYNRKVMVAPGSTRRTSIPAKYKSITKQVVADPGSVREIPVPAQYRNFQVEYLADPGGERLVDVPAKYGTVSKKTLTASDRYEWRRVVCDPVKGRVGAISGSSSGYSSSAAAMSSAASSSSAYASSASTSQYSSGTVVPTVVDDANESALVRKTTTTTTSSGTSGYYYGSDQPVYYRGPARPRK